MVSATGRAEVELRPSPPSRPAEDHARDIRADCPDSSARQTLTITNIGGSDVQFSSLSSSNPSEFAVLSSNCGGSLAPSASCQFEIAFTPGGPGPRTASITVVSSGSASLQTVALTGVGTQASGVVAAVEYYHAVFDHYFVTVSHDEITKLDNGTFVGWAPTGRSFNVYPSTGARAGSVAACRFFSTSFDPKSSHFYTPSATECTIVKTNRDWTFEGEVFNVTPAGPDGSCASGTQPVYRMYNNGSGGAPNHRYTTDASVRTQMLAKGWIPEGFGAVGVIMCSPISTTAMELFH
jgi:hypothetical protein